MFSFTWLPLFPFFPPFAVFLPPFVVRPFPIPHVSSVLSIPFFPMLLQLAIGNKLLSVRDSVIVTGEMEKDDRHP